jgi:hypothetical protein
MTIRSWLAGVAAVGVVAAGAAMTAPAATASGQLPHPAAVNKVTSQKWAGYAALADRRKDVRYVAADFIVESPRPCHTQDNQPGDVSTTQWIGLGGYSRGITEQIGVVETCSFMDDDEFEFWASYSGKSGSGVFFGCEEVHGDTCPRGVEGGDRVELSVYYNGKSYRLILRDVTKKISRTVYERCSKCTSKSAEVISLAASTATNPPLTGLSNVSFFGVRVTSADGKHGTMAPQPRYWTTAEITRLDSAGDTLGKPYPLLRHGRGFSVFANAFTGP